MSITGDEKPTITALRIIVKVLQDIGCSDRDIITVTNRVTHEGLEFLTKTLPALGKALDRGLGNALFKLPSAFKRKWRDTEIPAFCSSLFCAVFERNGALKDDADPVAVKHLRTICFLFYKLNLPFSAEETDLVLQNFVDIDSSIEPLKVSIETVYSRRLTTRVFSDFSFEKAPNPKHGPGVVSNIRIFDKWNYYPPYSKVVEHFGRRTFNHDFETHTVNFYVYLCALFHVFFCLHIEVIPYMPTAKVICVPKDSRGPRLISCEPAEHQFIQQSLFNWTKDRLESHPLCSGSVNFTDQGINGELARIGSQSLEWSTLDLKDASDRVSLELVEYLFGGCPEFLASLLACRSNYTLIEKTSGSFHCKLRKFAPMGSAVCFTTLAWVVFSLIHSTLCYRVGLSNDQAKTSFFVYGDDIVIKSEYAQLAINVLQSHGLLVNKDKSFINSHFLESCGVDAFKGIDVTPVRARQIVSRDLSRSPLKQWLVKKNLKNPSICIHIVKTVSLAQQLSKAGYGRASDYCYRLSEQYLGCKLPYGTEKAPYLSRWTTTSEDAWSSNRAMDLEIKSKAGPSIFCFVKQPIRINNFESGYGRLRRILPVMGLESSIPTQDEFVAPRKYVLRRRKMSRFYETSYSGGVACAN